MKLDTFYQLGKSLWPIFKGLGMLGVSGVQLYYLQQIFARQDSLSVARREAFQKLPVLEQLWIRACMDASLRHSYNLSPINGPFQAALGGPCIPDKGKYNRYAEYRFLYLVQQCMNAKKNNEKFQVSIETADIEKRQEYDYRWLEANHIALCRQHQFLRFSILNKKWDRQIENQIIFDVKHFRKEFSDVELLELNNLLT